MRVLHHLLILLACLSPNFWGGAGGDSALGGESRQEREVRMISGVSQGYPRKLIDARTDVLSLEINPSGGGIEQVRLLNFRERRRSSSPLLLIGRSSRYLRQIFDEVLVEDRYPLHRMRFTLLSPPQGRCVLADGQDELRLLLTCRAGSVTCLKTFVLRRGSFAVDVTLEICNEGDTPSDLKISGTFDAPVGPTDEERFAASDPGEVLCCDGMTRCRRYGFGRLLRKDLDTAPSRIGWIGVARRYFVVVWMPPVGVAREFFSRGEVTRLRVGFRSTPARLEPRSVLRLDSSLWIGPRGVEVAPGRIPRMGDAVDHGWLGFISRPVLRVLRWIHRRVNNWGLSIVAVTVVTRLSMHPLLRRQQASAVRMRALRPKLSSIRERFAHDQRRQRAEMFELYRREGVNPLDGLLPLFVQIPVFLALYQVISGAVELRHAAFVLWIDDLSAPDPRCVLPILTGMSTFLAQDLARSPSDPPRRGLLLLGSAILTGCLLRLPAGLLLHHATGNVMTVLQQRLLLRSEPQPPLERE